MTESASQPRILSADAILPMDPALPRVLTSSGLVITGERITAVGELAELRRQFGELPCEHHPGTILPGFVNAHTHLELSYQAAERLKTANFPDWVEALIAGYPPPEHLESVVRGAVRRGAADSLRAGVTTLGDISRHAQLTRDELAILARSSRFSVPRVVSFGEVMGLGNLRDRAPALIQAAAAMPSIPSPDPLVPLSPGLLVPGISPHAPYTVEGPTLRACVRQAILQGMPIAMHLAELADETPFLRDLSGPLGREWNLMRKMDILDERVPLMTGAEGGPIRWAQRWGLLLADARDPVPRGISVLLAHVNYCDHAELAQLAASRASVAYCPRTHAYFNHPPHRYRDMLAAGINVCLATDSLASNPDLSLLREAQLLWRRDHVDPYALLEMITRRGAMALGLAGQVGTLAAGKFADLVLLPTNGESDVMEQIVSQATGPATVWTAGQRI